MCLLLSEFEGGYRTFNSNISFRLAMPTSTMSEASSSPSLTAAAFSRGHVTDSISRIMTDYLLLNSNLASGPPLLTVNRKVD